MSAGRAPGVPAAAPGPALEVAPPRGLRRYLPHMVVFLTSMGVMIIELVASRLVSKYFGSSLYTWTGIIGVVLGGISLGNYLGGRLADRFAPRRIISVLLLAASLLVFLILVLDLLLYRVLDRGAFAGVTAAMVARSVLLIVVLFLLPSTALGTISPVMAKYALEDSTRVGKTVGSIYAMSAVGSIVGTLLAGFVLIPVLGITTIVVLVGGLLAALALLVGPHRAVSAAWVGAVALAAVLLHNPVYGFALYDPDNPDSRLLHLADSLYSHIEVRDVLRGGGSERILILDGLIHSRYDPESPDTLLYEYEGLFDALTREHVAGLDRAGRRLTTLTLGGGGCVYPSVLQRRYPESRNEVVEIDAEVLEVARRYFGLDPAPEQLSFARPAPATGSGTGRGSTQASGLHLAAADARNYVQAVVADAGPRDSDGPGTGRYDIVYADAFNSFSVPYHLTTREFTAMIAAVLHEDGLLVANCIDIFALGRFLNAYRNTLEAVFPHVAVFHDSRHVDEFRSTFVLAAAFRPIEQEVLRAQNGTVIGHRFAEESLAELRRRNGAVVLTDAYAPVESLIAPVFLQSVDR